MKPRERLLVCGGAGSGKTYGWLKLASYFRNSSFYVIDTEIGAERSLQEFPELTNVIVYPVVDWTDYRKAESEICSQATDSSWVVVDMADKAWTSVQRYYIEQIFSKEMGEYFLEARKKVKKDSVSLFAGRDAALKGWADWSVINRLYEDWILPLIYRIPAHLYMATAAQAVSADDEKEVRELYGPYGLKPAGQKALPHQPDTVLLLAHSKDGYYVSTVKDRGGRKYFDRQKLHNLAVQYGAIAGWKRNDVSISH
jgi:hypothetical protein